MSRKPSDELVLRQFQSEVDAIREEEVGRGPRVAIWSMVAMLVIFVGLTVVIPVDRVVSSSDGTIIPTTPVSVYQALDASIIKEIAVREGQVVKAGQVLALLDPTFTTADVAQLRLQVASLDSQITRAEGELAGKKPLFPSNADPAHRGYAALQAALYDQRVAQYSAQVASLNGKIRTIEATIVKLKNDEARYSERAKIAEQIQTMRSALREKEVGSLLNLLTSTDQRLELLRTMENEHNALVESQHQLEGYRGDLDSFKQQWAATLSQEIVTARNTRDQAASQLAKADKHQDLVVMRASEDAIVLTLAKLSVGSVLKGGDQLMTLMPLDAGVEAEVRVESRDVGFLRVGDSATIKVDAFNPAEHGFADGAVKWISGGAFATDDQSRSVTPFYKVRLGLTSLHFFGVPDGFRLIPGMTLTADIRVGKRSLARYLIGGAIRNAGEAMREP